MLSMLNHRTFVSIITDMKKAKSFIPLALILFFLMGLSSCIVTSRGYSGNGNPKGWHRNSNNPHHHHSTNPGKGHDKHNK
jgi:hypothetical protein